MTNSAYGSDTDKAFLEKARRYCAIAEQCESGVRQKLIGWGASPDTLAPIIEQLRAEGYLDDMRYARAYCESKVLRQHWGRMKVVYQLRAKHFSRETIDRAMEAIGDEEYRRMLHETALRKRVELGSRPDAERRVAAFLASRGFSASEISQEINLQ